jgi:hypothetical protein
MNLLGCFVYFWLDEKPVQNGACAESVTKNESAKELQYQNIVKYKDMKETSQKLSKSLRS